MHCKSKGNKLCIFKYMCVSSFDSFDPVQCTVLYILIYIDMCIFRLFRPYWMYCTVHSICINVHVFRLFRPYSMYCTVHSYIYSCVRLLTLSYILYYTLYELHCFFRLFRPHTVNSYNFLNNGPIFNWFIPLELSQSHLLISGFICSILLIRSKESKETAWLYSTVYAFRSKESKDTKDRNE